MTLERVYLLYAYSFYAYINWRRVVSTVLEAMWDGSPRAESTKLQNLRLTIHVQPQMLSVTHPRSTDSVPTRDLWVSPQDVRAGELEKETAITNLLMNHWPAEAS